MEGKESHGRIERHKGGIIIARICEKIGGFDPIYRQGQPITESAHH